MMKPSPTATLVVVEANLVLELLVVALDAPADHDEPYQILDRHGLGDRGEPVFRRGRLAAGPLGEQPLGIARGRAALVAMRGADPQPREARPHRSPRSLPPAHGAP